MLGECCCALVGKGSHWKTWNSMTCSPLGGQDKDSRKMGFAFFLSLPDCVMFAPGHSFRDCESLFPVHHGTFAAELDWEESYCLQLHLQDHLHTLYILQHVYIHIYIYTHDMCILYMYIYIFLYNICIYILYIYYICVYTIIIYTIYLYISSETVVDAAAETSYFQPLGFLRNVTWPLTLDTMKEKSNGSKLANPMSDVYQGHRLKSAALSVLQQINPCLLRLLDSSVWQVLLGRPPFQLVSPNLAFDHLSSIHRRNPAPICTNW